MTTSAIVVIVLAGALLLLAIAAIRIVREYERVIVFRLGRLRGERGPGLVLIIPLVERTRWVNLQVDTADIPAQDLITKDNITIRVEAAVFFRVVDPVKAVVAIRDYKHGVLRIAQTTLRATIGQHELDELLANQAAVNELLKQIIDAGTEPWGVSVVTVETKDVDLPDTMKRAMARQAEAERERRAKVIAADGEGWAPSSTPRRYRDADEFFDRVAREARLSGETQASFSVAAAATVLRRHISAGEIEDVMQALPESMRALLAESSV